MHTTKIMLIRHAEKPDPHGSAGMTMAGLEDPRELSVRGWHRAGGLLALFGPSRALVAALATPTAILASRPTRNSVRPLRTVETLAYRLGIPIDTSHGNGDETALIDKAMMIGGVVLVSWKHDGLPGLANAITGNVWSTPQHWPPERYDFVWTFDRPQGSSAWAFQQVPQLLLPGDCVDPIVHDGDPRLGSDDELDARRKPGRRMIAKPSR